MRASLKRIIDSTIFCGENEILLRGHWATDDGRKPFRKERFSSVARVQIKLTVGKCTGKTLLIRSSATLDFTDWVQISPPSRRHQSEVDSLDKKEKEQNRASLKRIIDTTIFCGENETPLRGHWATDGRNPLEKEGKFRALLGYRSN
ncbi:hypothetical protein J6590_084687 [Homalodisca vitripennis]|nr:hypothetical protein J6590_084687 [Homalodisca vitripennis]